MNKLTTLTLTALLVAAFSSAAYAQVPVASSEEELVLAFRIDDATGQGANTDLEVDLGSVSQFTSTSYVNLSGASALAVADLVATYGSNWDTRGDLVFSVAGVNSAGNVNGTALVTQSGTAQKSTSAFPAAASNIAAEQQELGNFTLTGNSSAAGTFGSNTTPASGQPGTISAEVALSGGDYGFFTDTTIATGNGGLLSNTEAIVNGLTTLQLDSYVVGSGRNGTAPTELGTFTLTSSGSFYYGTPVPEPSTYAMVLGALGMLFVGLRLRRSSTLS